MNAQKAFTLSEVLLTLAIVGIISALIIPSLLYNVQKEQWVESLKKMYINFNTATNQLLYENSGTLEGNIGNNQSDLLNIFESKLIYSKKCLSNTAGNCFPNQVTYMLNDHTPFSPGTPGAILNDGSCFYIPNGFRPNCDGTYFVRNGENQMCSQIVVDVNCFKPPNILGRDVFYLNLTKYGFYPHLIPIGNNGYSLYSNTSTFGNCEPKDNTQSWNGNHCAGRIMLEGWKMNY